MYYNDLSIITKKGKCYMKKRFITIFLSLAMFVMSAFVFSGCGILQENNKRYYADAVAKVGDEVVTRNEVLTMFNYYYYSAGYYQYGYSEEQVYKMVLESLIKNKILVQEARKVDSCKIDDNDRSYIWEQVFNNISTQIDSHESEIKKIYGVEEDEEETDSTSSTTKFTEYERKKPENSLTMATVVKTKEEWLTSIREEANEATNRFRYLAYRKYINELVRSAEKYEKNAGTEEEILQKEIDRLYKYYEESRLVAKYTAFVTGKLTVTDVEINDAYNELLKKQMQDYVISGAYDSAITSASNTELVINRTNNSSKSYFTVQHILLKFADYDDSLEISTNVKGASKYLAEHRYFTYQKGSGSMESAYEEVYLKDRDAYAESEGSLDLSYINPTTGEKNKDDEGNEKKLTKLSEFDTIMNEYYTQNSGDNTKLAEEFLKLKFSYSKDSNVTDLTNLTNLIGYTFSCEKSDSNGYVSEFSDTAYELYNQFLTDGTYGMKKVVTNFGVHYILFTGLVSDTTLGLNDKFTLTRNETVADYLYDTLMTEKVSSAITDVTSILYNQYKSDDKVKIYCESYEDCK